MCKPYFESSNSQFIKIQSTVLVSKNSFVYCICACTSESTKILYLVRRLNTENTKQQRQMILQSPVRLNVKES